MSGTLEDRGILVVTDARLLEGIRHGDRASFDTLFSRYYSQVYGVLVRLTGSPDEADDLAQEVFLRLYRRPLETEREHNLGAWLYRVATNLGYNALRGQSRRERYQAAAAPDGMPEQADPAELEARRAEQSRVREALAAIKARDAQLLVLRQAGLSYAEVAEVLGVARGSVGTLLIRAERAFREAYEALER